MKKKDWIKGAIKHPGSLTNTARQHGAITKDGTIQADWLHDAAAGKFGAKTEKRAELALTFRKMKK